MLIISPGMPADVYGRGTGFLHEAKDQSRAMDNLVAWSKRATSPSDVAATIHRAFAEFRSARPRPVHLEIPLDVLDAVESVEVGPPLEVERPQPADGPVAAAVRILAAARKPGLVVGGGGQDAGTEIARLVHLLDAIIVTTANGKGAFPETDPLALGVALGYPAGRAALADCDVVVAIGTELSLVDLENERLLLPGRVIRIDIDPGQLNMNLQAECGIHGDAALTLRRILSGLTSAHPGGGASRASEARRRLDKEIEARAGGATEVARAIESCLDEDTIVVCDTSMLCYNGLIPTRFVEKPRSSLNPTGYATLGYALPAGIGAKLAEPDRPVIVVSGDGGILFTLSELSVAVDHRLQLPIVVVNNKGYGEIRQAMIARGIDPFGVTFDPPRFAAVADAFGARGVSASNITDLQQAIRSAFQLNGPTLIEVTA
jgi:acetolactate synthase-1/2/3 large subunit